MTGLPGNPRVRRGTIAIGPPRCSRLPAPRRPQTAPVPSGRSFVAKPFSIPRAASAAKSVLAPGITPTAAPISCSAQGGAPQARAQIGARGPGPAHEPDKRSGRPPVSSARISSARPNMPYTNQRDEADAVTQFRYPEGESGCPPPRSVPTRPRTRADQDQRQSRNRRGRARSPRGGEQAQRKSRSHQPRWSDRRGHACEAALRWLQSTRR